MSTERRLTQDDAIAVLVADDDPIFRSVVATKLKSLRGEAIEAEDGVAAWEIATTASLDLAIVDLEMPNLDGFDLISCMRGHPRTRHLPIVVITSHSGSANIERALRVGATSFLTKPVNWSTFEHHIGYLLHLAQAERKARSSLQLTAMLARLRETLLCDLSTQVKEEASYLQSLVRGMLGPSEQRQSPGSGTGSLRTLACRLAVLEAVAEKALNLTEMLGHEVTVADRHVPLTSIVGDVIEDVSPDALSRGVGLRVASEPEAVIVACDAAAVAMALSELVRNGVRHSPEGSSVEVSTRMFPDGLLAIEIADNGTGMAPDVVASAASLSAGDLQSGHAGYGIVLAKAVAEAHGGALEIQSMLNRGTTVRFVVPPERVKCNSAAAA